jgi:hypothetical protein
VVYSGTGGLETDSASLTFNGTTLSAGGFSTTGLSTLVQTVTIGNSNFSGVAVFAPATPAKLYMGTGTVTDVTSAVSATNTTGAIASLAITPIAASNTGVTYTNASTLYIAGAPSAGTNITITNPYALYVNAGASYFGGAVSFASQPTFSGGTANGVAYLNGSKVLTTGSALTWDGTTFGVTGAIGIGQSSTFPTVGFTSNPNGYLYVMGGTSGVLTQVSSVNITTVSSTGLAVTGSLDLLSAVNGNIAKFKSSSNYGTVVADNSTSTGGGVFFRVEKWNASWCFCC